MKRIILYLISFLAVSCELRELTYGYYPVCNLTLDVDWSLFGETPDGMTAIFYPKRKGLKPVVHTTNEVRSTIVPLSKGTYDIILFNQSPGEFGTLNFKGLNQYNTAEVYLETINMELGEEEVALQPERFAVATMEDFTVTEEMVVQSMQIAAGKDDVGTHISTAIRMTPKCVVTPGIVRIHIEGFPNLGSLRGSISGIAGNFIHSQYSSGSRKVTHLFESWSRQQYQDNPDQGLVKTSFSSFGHPNMLLSRVESSVMTRANDSEWENSTLDISILLSDNETILDYSFDVGDYVRKVEENGQMTLIIDIEGQIRLPDVVTNNGGGSFDATVDDWGEEENVGIQF